MANDLIRQQGSSYPAPSSVEQTGKTNVNVTNQDGGVVNFNYNFHPGTPADSAEKLIAIQQFSKQYYQLLVTTEDDVFETNVVSVMANRALTSGCVPPEIYERCSPLTEEEIAELKTFPAIVCRENTAYNGETDPNQWAMYCYIKRVKKEGKIIKVGFKPIAPLPQNKMCTKKNAIYFDLNMSCALTDLNWSGWTVHKVNLFEAFDEAEIPNMPRPM